MGRARAVTGTALSGSRPPASILSRAGGIALDEGAQVTGKKYVTVRDRRIKAADLAGDDAWAKGEVCTRPPRSTLRATTTPLKPRHTSLKFLTRLPSTRSPCLHHLTPSPPRYSGPVRAPAFMERQTGAPRTGFKSSTWPPSVSRSTDRVTQDNGIDPKPFWRLARYKGPHLIKPRPGRPSRSPRRRQRSCGASDYSLGAPCNPEKWGLPPIRSPSCLRNKGLSLKRIGCLYPIFRQFPTPSMGENFKIPATDCHQLPPALAINASMQHEQQDLTRKQDSGSAAPIPTQNPLETAARPPLDAGKTRFALARRRFSHAKRHGKSGRKVVEL